jgi:hypothetical protein
MGEVMSDGSGMALCTERTRERPDDLQHQLTLSGHVAQSAEAMDLKSIKSGFESQRGYWAGSSVVRAHDS